MKRIISLILSAALLLLSPSSVLAHPGRTDIYGGHYNDETGEYHYHHGFPAHQHIDGECPYDFVDAADHTSSEATTIRSNDTDDYTKGYQQGFARGKENAEYTDGVSDGYQSGYQDGESAGYQAGLEDGKKNQFQYYPIIIASISVIAGIIILALTTNRKKIKEDLTDQISSGKRKLRDLEEELQLEMDKSKRDFDSMKSSYQNELDKAAQRFNQLQTDHQKELGHIREQLYASEKKYEQALIQFGEAKREASQAITSSQLSKYSADQRVKSCEQFIAMFGGSAEEFFAHQDAPQRLAKMQADYLTLVYEASAIYLENKERPAYKEAQRIRELKADTAKYIERMKKAEYECDQLREQLRIAKKVYSVSDHTET